MMFLDNVLTQDVLYKCPNKCPKFSKLYIPKLKDDDALFSRWGIDAIFRR